MINNVIKVFPYPFRSVIRKLNRKFFKSSEYWERRYARGGTSGVGSYGRLALYKAEIINSFVKKHNIQTVIELGCGDGNQLAYYRIPNYIGLDVSDTAIKRCKKRFSGDESKRFFLYDNQSSGMIGNLEKADLTLSIDVLYHLVEDSVLFKHIADLFRYSNQYVMIYSTNFDKAYKSPHQVNRKFTPIIEKNIKGFELVETIVNPHKGDETKSDFFIYEKAR